MYFFVLHSVIFHSLGIEYRGQKKQKQKKIIIIISGCGFVPVGLKIIIIIITNVFVWRYKVVTTEAPKVVRNWPV